MTGPELRALMKARRIRTTDAAAGIGVNPQTIRNLWQKEEVPRLYLMALIAYTWALGPQEGMEAKRSKAFRKIISGVEDAMPKPPPVQTESRGVKIPGIKTASIEKKETDLWSKLK